jgi:hypothetical protein
LKSIGFTCERISFIRYQQYLYFFTYDRDFKQRLNHCVLERFDLHEEQFSIVKEFSTPFVND